MTQKKNPAVATEIVLVLDRSGSMHSICEATIQGVNEFLAGQRAVKGEAFVSLYQFDHEFEAVFEATPAGATPPIDERSYQPRGSTALLDAIGEAVERTRLRVDCCDDDASVVLAIMTDGLENASRRFTVRAIRRLLGACERQGWQVLFLGANIDAVAEGERLGIRRSRAATYAATDACAQQALRCVSQKMSRFRTTGKAEEMDFTVAERACMAPPAED